HLSFSRQSGRLLRKGRISPVRAGAAGHRLPPPLGPRCVRSGKVSGHAAKVCALSLDMVLIKTHTSPRIRFFVVGRRCWGKRDEYVERRTWSSSASEAVATSRGQRNGRR